MTATGSGANSGASAGETEDGACGSSKAASWPIFPGCSGRRAGSGTRGAGSFGNERIGSRCENASGSGGASENVEALNGISDSKAVGCMGAGAGVRAAAGAGGSEAGTGIVPSMRAPQELQKTASSRLACWQRGHATVLGAGATTAAGAAGRGSGNGAGTGIAGAAIEGKDGIVGNDGIAGNAAGAAAVTGASSRAFLNGGYASAGFQSALSE